MSTHDPDVLRIAGRQVPVVTVNTVVVGTGTAGFCAADRLWEFGQTDIVMVTDKIGAGTSRNAGSDKQTYYKLTLSGDDADSVREMAQTLFAGGAMDGDNALVEAALSARGFLRLCELGVPFPQNRYGEFVGYKTDHDPRRRATSVGPYTSRSMVEQLEKKVARNGTRIFDDCRVVDVIVRDGAVAGLLVLRTDVRAEPQGGAWESPFLLFRCTNLVFATGGPAGMYATRVFPNGQWGASGAAYRAGVHGKNLTEWQFGLASTAPRWNVSGTYMQALPRFVSTDADGRDEREFLTEVIGDYGRQLSMIFLKGYQWPFDIRKALGGSSLIDLLVHRETVLRGRRVFLDFRRNPVRDELDAAALSPEARDYLERAGALFGTPVERLQQMNRPAYEFYLHRNPYLDLETQLLEVQVGVAVQVELVGGPVHLLQPLDGGAEERAGTFEVVPRLGGQRRSVELVADGVAAEVQEHPATAQHGLAVDEQVDQRGAVQCLADVEGPLVALEEDHRELAPVVADHLGEELPLVTAVGVRRDEPWQRLHVGAGDVPSRRGRGQAELPLSEVLAVHTRTVGGA